MSVVITGLGPVSAIGCGRQAFWNALVAGEHGFGNITLCDVSRSSSKIGAEVKLFRLENFVEKGRLLTSRLPRPVQLALAASVLALQDAGFGTGKFDPERVGVFAGTSLGNLGDALAARDEWFGDKFARLRPDKAFSLFNHSAACVLSSYLDVRGPIHTISTGCNSGLDALGMALRLIQSGSVDAMLVVGTDSELIPEILAALNASKSLTTRFNDDPGRSSRPFDVDRDGNVIGEGAAALLLEAEQHARARGAQIYARLCGYTVCAAGRQRKYSHNQPQMDIQPGVRALTRAMQEAGWQPKDVDLVNANGSSSVKYDVLEARVLAEVFGSTFPHLRVHSIKSMLGQHGAGSTALQVASACLAIAYGIVPPTINHEQTDPACGSIQVVTRAETCHPKNVLVHAIGFGGFYYSCGALTAPNLD